MGIMTRRVWVRSDVELLIKAYQNCDMLWDPRSEAYKNKALKRAAYVELSKQFGCSVDEVTRKLHNLRNQFNCELKKLRRHTFRSPRNAHRSYGEGFESKWPFFQQLAFLRNVSKVDMGMDIQAMKLEAEEHREESYTSDNENDTTNVEAMYQLAAQEEEQQQQQQQYQRTSSQKQPNIAYQNNKKHKSEELDPDQMVVIPEKFSPRMSYSSAVVAPAPPPLNDQFDIFGLYVASELKNLSSHYLQKKMKRKIQEIILEVNEEDERLASPLFPLSGIHHN